jgi:hypothetical protein
MDKSGLKNGTQQLVIFIAASRAFLRKNPGVNSGVSQVMKTGVRNGRSEVQTAQLGVKTGAKDTAMDTHGMRTGKKITQLQKLLS